MIASGSWESGWKAIALWVPVALFGAFSGCGGEQLQSTWCDREIRIDGENTEWSGALTDFPDKRLTVGVMNDGEFLYLSAFVGDEQLRTMAMMHGVTVWFDPDGGEERRFGIRYPVGLGPEEPGGFVGGMRPGGRDAARLEKAFGAATSELEILGPDENDRHRVRVSHAPGIEVAAKASRGGIAFEWRVPLAKTDESLFAVGANPGAEIGVGLFVGMNRKRMRPPGGGPPDGGGFPGGGPPGGGFPGGGGRGGGMGPPGGRRGAPKPLELWAKVELRPSAAAGGD